MNGRCQSRLQGDRESSRTGPAGLACGVGGRRTVMIVGGVRSEGDGRREMEAQGQDILISALAWIGLARYQRRTLLWGGGRPGGYGGREGATPTVVDSHQQPSTAIVHNQHWRPVRLCPHQANLP